MEDEDYDKIVRTVEPFTIYKMGSNYTETWKVSDFVRPESIINTPVVLYKKQPLTKYRVHFGGVMTVRAESHKAAKQLALEQLKNELQKNDIIDESWLVGIYEQIENADI